MPLVVGWDIDEVIVVNSVEESGDHALKRRILACIDLDHSLRGVGLQVVVSLRFFVCLSVQFLITSTSVH